jgi:hypothetical protein
MAAPHHVEFEVHPKQSIKQEEHEKNPTKINEFAIQLHRESKGAGERGMTKKKGWGRERNCVYVCVSVHQHA